MHTVTSGEETASPVQLENTTQEVRSHPEKVWVGDVLRNLQKWASPCLVNGVQIQVLKSKRLGDLLPKLQQEAQEMLKPDRFSSVCGRTHRSLTQ